MVRWDKEYFGPSPGGPVSNFEIRPALIQHFAKHY